MSSIEQRELQRFGIGRPEITTLHIPSRGKEETSISTTYVKVANGGIYRESKPEQEISPETALSPKVLLFDLGHVFLDASYYTIFQALEEFGVSRERAKLIFTIKEYDDFVRGKIDGSAFCDALRAVLDLPNLTDEQIRKIHDRHIFGLVPGMVELLENVTQKYGTDNIVFVTDACDWQTARQQELIDLSSYRVITSNEAGMLKSDPETVDDQRHRRTFFLYVLEELGLQPQEALLIDDSPEKIATAKGYGIQTIQFESAIQLETALRERNMLK